MNVRISPWIRTCAAIATCVIAVLATNVAAQSRRPQPPVQQMPDIELPSRVETCKNGHAFVGGKCIALPVEATRKRRVDLPARRLAPVDRDAKRVLKVPLTPREVAPVSRCEDGTPYGGYNDDHQYCHEGELLERCPDYLVNDRDEICYRGVWYPQGEP